MLEITMSNTQNVIQLVYPILTCALTIRISFSKRKVIQKVKSTSSHNKLVLAKRYHKKNERNVNSKTFVNK